jgi:hypothetical protein
MINKQLPHIVVKSSTKLLLDSFVKNKQDTYDDIINRLIVISQNVSTTQTDPRDKSKDQVS